MAETTRNAPFLRLRSFRLSRPLFVGALVPVLAWGFAAIAGAGEPGPVRLGKPEIARISVGVGAPTLSRPGSVRLHDGISDGRGVPIVAAGSKRSDGHRRDVDLRPTEQTAQTAAPTDLGVRPAGLATNYRGTAFVPWLETLSLINDEFGGYAGSPGLHSQWSSEIDQWIAMVDAPGAFAFAPR